jgi:hypothetical protein
MLADMQRARGLVNERFPNEEIAKAEAAVQFWPQFEDAEVAV